MRKLLSLLFLLPAIAWGQTYPYPQLQGQAYGVLWTSQPVAAAGSGYQMGDTITIAADANATPAVFSVFGLGATSATVTAGGSGGTNGACTVTSTVAPASFGGITTQAQFTGTVSGGVLTGPLTIVVPGVYILVLPTAPFPVSGCNLTGATVTVNTWGVQGVNVQQQGYYSFVPQGVGAQVSTSGSGTGAIMAPTFGPYAATVQYPGLSFIGSSGNAFQGYQAGSHITTGAEDVAFGPYSMLLMTSGQFNSAFGHRALGAENTGNFNVAVGTDAMRNAFGNSNTVAIGESAVRNMSASNNTGVGYSALAGSTTVTNNTGVQNTAVGYLAIGGTSFTTGSYNSALGGNSLVALTTGSNNAAGGYNSLAANTVANYNTAFGANAGFSVVSAGQNSYFGFDAGQNAISGNNVAIGALNFSAANNQSFQETCIGALACIKLTLGKNNVVIGYSAAGSVQASGVGNILIGAGSDTPAGATNYWLAIGDANDSAPYVFAGSTAADTTSNLSSCGTTPTIIAQASDIRGTFTTGTAATACTLTFATARSAAPTCIVTARSGTAPAYTTSTTALTLSTAAASATYDYFCTGS